MNLWLILAQHKETDRHRRKYFRKCFINTQNTSLYWIQCPSYLEDNLNFFYSYLKFNPKLVSNFSEIHSFAFA